MLLQRRNGVLEDVRVEATCTQQTQCSGGGHRPEMSLESATDGEYQIGSDDFQGAADFASEGSGRSLSPSRERDHATVIKSGQHSEAAAFFKIVANNGEIHRNGEASMK